MDSDKYSLEDIYLAGFQTGEEMIEAAKILYIDTGSREFKGRLYFFSLFLEYLGVEYDDYTVWLTNYINDRKKENG